MMTGETGRKNSRSAPYFLSSKAVDPVDFCADKPGASGFRGALALDGL
jgi:hypothetical protein